MSLGLTTIILFAVFIALLFLGCPISVGIVISSIVAAASSLSWEISVREFISDSSDTMSSSSMRQDSRRPDNGARDGMQPDILSTQRQASLIRDETECSSPAKDTEERNCSAAQRDSLISSALASLFCSDSSSSSSPSSSIRYRSK